MLAGLVGAADGFSGWQAMRVVRTGPGIAGLVVADLDGDRRDEVLLVNGRQSRLELLTWRGAEGEQPRPTHANDLPLAREFTRQEIVTDGIPLAVTPVADGRLAVVTGRNRVVVLARQGNAWRQETQLPLLPGRPLDSVAPLRWPGPGPARLLVACEQGIQVLPLDQAGRASWLLPQDTGELAAWSLTDLDDDGRADLVLHPGGNQAGRLQWRSGTAEGFRPVSEVPEAPNLREARLVRDAGGTMVLAGLPARTQTLINTFRLQQLAERPLGRQRSLAPGGAVAGLPLSGLRIEGRPQLAVVEREQPQLRLHALEAGGWNSGAAYPVPARINSLAGLAAVPGSLLLLSETDGILYRSDWQGGRLSWPKPWTANLASDPSASTAAGGKALALGRADSTTWWVQKRDKDLVLGRWTLGQAAPTEIVYAGIGDKIAKAVWAGGERVLVQESFTRGAALVDRADGKGRLRRPAHLGKVELEQLRLIPANGGLQPALLVEGVLQWLDDELAPKDQILLGDGLQIVDAVRLQGDLWALERAGRRIHRLQPDAGGLLRRADYQALAGGNRVLVDDELGCLLLDERTVTALDAGRGPVLLPMASADDSEHLPDTPGADASFDRIEALDLDGRPGDELLVIDDARRGMTAFSVIDGGASLRRLLSWPVYENRAYPYGGDRPSREAEPRELAAGDVDGDGRRDLVMVIHDRVLIYLGGRPAAAGSSK
jgi:hypothetical protein